MIVFAIGLLTIAGLIPVIVKLEKAEKELRALIDREHEKAIQGIARYHAMKNGVYPRFFLTGS